MQLSRIFATATLGGALALGSVGVASAATPAPAHRMHHINCAKASTTLTKVAAVAKAAPALESEGQALAATLNSAGLTKAADRVTKAVQRVEKVAQNQSTIVARIKSACPGA